MGSSSLVITQDYFPTYRNVAVAVHLNLSGHSGFHSAPGGKSSCRQQRQFHVAALAGGYRTMGWRGYPTPLRNLWRRERRSSRVGTLSNDGAAYKLI